MREVLLIAGLLSLAACADEAAENAAVSPVAPSEIDGMTLSEDMMQRPVTIGRDGPQMDACGSAGVIVGDAVVRAGPSDAAPDKMRLKDGAQVVGCDSAADGQWLGIVYHPSLPELPDCGTGTPVAEVQPYRGACSSGWVRAEQVRMVAG